MKHLIWDWNGTLFDDTSAVVAAAGQILAPYRDPVTADEYRTAHRRPIKLTYEMLLGRPLDDDERDQMDAAFDRAYVGFASGCALADGIPQLLASWRESGGTQSLLSMARHDPLLTRVTGFGIDDLFVRVEGLPSDWPSGGTKAEHLQRHLAGLAIDPAEALVIGDTVDDALAARRASVRAVLYSGGASVRSELESAGVPVVDSLAEAIGYAQ